MFRQTSRWYGFMLLFILFVQLYPAGAQTPQQMNVEEVFDKLQTNSFDPSALVRFIPQNVPAWYARWWVMENAKKSIDITYFIVEKDVFGMSILGMLMKKAREGLKVRIMLDARGTKTLTRTFVGQDVMQALAKLPNVQIKTFNPASPALLQAFEDIRNVTASNHDKIILADEEFLITGGRNIAMNYFVDPRDVPTVYRDSDVVIRSKIVAGQAKQAFDEEFNQHGNFTITKDLLGDWKNRSYILDLAYQAMRRYLLGQGLFKVDAAKMSKDSVTALEGFNKELSIYKNLPGYASFRLFEGQHKAPARILDKNSRKGFRNDITFNIIGFMNTAKEEILIQNPYVVLTPDMDAAIKRASKRGVKIVIHTNSPMSSDSLLTQAMFLGDWKRILAEDVNVRIFGYKLQSKLHSKVFVFDRKVAVVGTYNLDCVSEQINSEEVAVVKSRSFATQVAKRIEEDMINSYEYKVQVQPDGSIKTVFGPETHSDPKVIKRLEMLQKLGWLRPLI